jgi:hypothetical protein
MLCRYIGILPKDADAEMLKADDAARNEIPKEVWRASWHDKQDK